VQYRVLGSLEVRDGDRSIPLGGAKQRALLAVLLVNANEVVSRDRLIDELWGDQPPETAVQSVQVYVSRLRKLLPEGVLVTRARGYVLEVEPESVDLQQFERLLAAARKSDPERASALLCEALALWRGAALAEFTGEPFALREGGRLEDLRLAAVEERIDADLVLGRHVDVVGELEALIAANPHRERLRGQLMLSLYRSGRQAEALEAYQQTRRVLDDLGIEPSENVRRLEKAILTQDPALEAPRRLVGGTNTLPGPLRVEGPFPFVGRARELDELRSILQLVQQGEGGRVVLIGGEAGSGKTRLARELVHEAAERGALVLYGRSDADVEIPYQPFVESLECLLRVADPDAFKDCLGSGAGELTRLLPDLTLQVGPLPAPMTGDPDTQRHRLHTEVGALLAQVSQSVPLVIVVDDIHWADVGSLHLVRQLARTTPEARVLLLATFRDKGEDARPEFSDALADLARIDAVIRLKLGSLTDDDIAEFIQCTVGVDAPRDLAHTLGGLTDGNPFLLCELWRTLVDADAVDSSGGTVRLTRPVAELGTPEGVRMVMHHRLSRLPPATISMLEVAAVAGAQFELSVLDEAVAFDKSTFDSAIENAIGRGMIEEVPEPRPAHRFTHELVRRAIYDQLTGIRRAELHLRVGEALEHLHAGNPTRVLAELAHHFTLASPAADAELERAVEYNRRAAKAALVSLAYEEAVTRLSTALELVKNQRSPKFAETGRELKLQLARLLRLPPVAEFERATRLLDEVVQEAAAAGDRRLESHALLERTTLRFLLDPNAVDQAQMRQQAETAVAVFDEFADEDGLARAWSAIAFCHFGANRYDEQRVALERALAHVRRADNDFARTELVRSYILSLLRGPTDVEEGIRRSQELIDETRANRLLQGLHELAQAAFAAMRERFVEARKHLGRGRAIFDEVRPGVAMPNEIGGWVALLAGDPVEAERELRCSYAILERLGIKSVLCTTAAALGQAVYLEGRFDEAELLSRTSEELGAPDDVINEMLWRQVRAKTLAQRGEFASAEELARRAVELGATTDALNGRGDSLMDLGEVLQLAGRSADAAAAIGEAPGLYEQKGNLASARRARERLREFAVV
jgi:predicted ATPase/DNA-binding SARP family transcriptional activator